jgi:hypothetical protein
MAVALPFLYGAAAIAGTAAAVKSMVTKPPAPPPLPTLPPAPDAAADNLDTEKARRAAMARRRQQGTGQFGKSATLLTGALGVPGPAPVERKSLLGA